MTIGTLVLIISGAIWADYTGWSLFWFLKLLTTDKFLDKTDNRGPFIILNLLLNIIAVLYFSIETIYENWDKILI